VLRSPAPVPAILTKPFDHCFVCLSLLAHALKQVVLKFDCLRLTQLAPIKGEEILLGQSQFPFLLILIFNLILYIWSAPSRIPKIVLRAVEADVLELGWVPHVGHPPVETLYLVEPLLGNRSEHGVDLESRTLVLDFLILLHEIVAVVIALQKVEGVRWIINCAALLESLRA